MVDQRNALGVLPLAFDGRKETRLDHISFV